MHVPLAKQDVAHSVDLHLGSILRVEKYAVAGLHHADVLTGADHIRPRQAAADLCSRGDHDAARGAAFAIRPVQPDEHPIVQ